MPDLALTRSPDDRRTYAVDGVGSIRIDGGLFSRGATAEAAGHTWRFSVRGFWQRAVEATDAAGTVIGEFTPRTFRRGGTVRWGTTELALQPASLMRERYALAEAGRELMVLDGKSWGRRPVQITLAVPDSVEPGLVLFAAFVVRQLAKDASNSAAAAVV